MATRGVDCSESGIGAWGHGAPPSYYPPRAHRAQISTVRTKSTVSTRICATC